MPKLVLISTQVSQVISISLAWSKLPEVPGKPFENKISSTLAIALFFIARILPDVDDPFCPTQTDLHVWFTCFVYELAGLYLSWASASYAQWLSTVRISDIAFMSARIVTLVLMSTLYQVTSRQKEAVEFHDSEQSGVLGHLQPNGSYGSFTSEQISKSLKTPSKDAQRTGWVDYLMGFGKLLPMLWPRSSVKLQIRALVCICLLILQRALNILVPHQLGVVVESLSYGNMPWPQLSLFVLYRGLQGQQGVIGAWRSILWIPISQSAYHNLKSAAFKHILTLSLDFHLSRRVGEVLSALSKGAALNTFLDSFIFQLFPIVADLWIAAVYLWIRFDAIYALMVIVFTWLYLYVTICMAKFRGRARRSMATRERQMEAIKADAFLSYETVHQNGAVEMETKRLEDHISAFQQAEYKVAFSLNILNAVQNGIFMIGAAGLCFLSAYQISLGIHEVASFVTLLTYLAQLQAPLNFFGSFYMQVQNNLVDAERMLELFTHKPTVVNKRNARVLSHLQGSISLSNVCFSYDARKPTIKNINLEIAPGTSVALVGESGSGKSTLMKLLFRFYDVDEGFISIDGVDIRDITLESWRSHLGVVPQDTILFNDTLLYNLLYAKPSATIEEVQRACEAASIHDRILSFPEQYQTVVGERGLKLSGGEKQRIAIARSFLRSPKILLLDEATSSLDSKTEKLIQKSLQHNGKGRTTITIAHRLSTIVDADQIVVLDEGRAVEVGDHQGLLKKNGIYTAMWKKQGLSDQSNDDEETTEPL